MLAGMDVYAADINEQRFAEAQAAGVKASFSDPAQLAQVQPEVIIDFAGFQETMLSAVQAVARGGQVVLVGLGAAQFYLPTMLFASNQVELIGSWGGGGTKNDIADVLALMASGQLTIPATLISFNEISVSLQNMTARRLTGKVIASINN